ncbi:helix-turn-helix transcriptional regulator [Amycolatopsis sp. A133]|uniref:helix-turn-helix transcriptional regulator n=1 Tax=Amycolatopsis sp. A133 TaxID=3064472 RepID=UPI0027FBCC98|nr:helix-turn-helix transcriptional regulator [Amycolatopsis sp. A133]MDQ7808921.1 helix-turn-helix transcriptional regulator [Amycolatopsis sp. A133]
MEASRRLGEFLKTRRSRLRPEDVGLATYGDRRRVPGLRREELTQLGGVPYCSRLEQGQSANASPEVLDALARAPRLDDTERRHLHEPAAGARKPAARRRPAPARVTPAVRQLLTALGDVPVVVLGRCSDVLAWNAAGHALFAGHLDPDAPERPGRRPNLAKLVFLDPHTRELYADWPAKARAVVATLRMASGRHLDDPRPAALVGELSVRSTQFAAWWADQRVKSGGDAVYEMRHPLVGAMTVTHQALLTEQDQHVVVATTEPGSPSHAAMTLLTHTTATARPSLPARG